MSQNTSEKSGHNNVASVSVVVGNTTIKSFAYFSLFQSAVSHHEFSLTLNDRSFDTPQNHRMEEAKKMLGKKITVTFKYKGKDNPERNFIGVVTKVGFSRGRNDEGVIILNGKSPTVLLDAAPHTQSFGGKQVVSLKSAVQEVIKEGWSSDYKFRVDTTYSNVPYLCQYEETHYNFLARIAETYGEQFFYDGQELHFGKLPPPEPPIKLIFGKDVEDVDIQLKAHHINRSFYGYNSNDNEVLKVGKTPVNHQSSLAKEVYDMSENIFKTPSLGVAPMKASTGNDIEAVQKSTIGSIAVDVFTVSGRTSLPFLYPGCTVDMEMLDTKTKDTNYLTKLMITQINHSVDSLGNYVGNFEAIASDTGFLPRPVFHTPIAEPQIARVVDNKNDKGCVQVRFDWQKDSTEWIRVMTPDAGSSDKVGKNRGFVAIPEIGDQVMVGFTHNHPDRPYVMGSLFHGKIGSGGGSGNNIKSLSSKSGHSIELNDGSGITIKDKSGKDIIALDGTNKISVMAGNEISLSTGKSSITLKADGTININGVKVTAEGTEFVNNTSGGAYLKVVKAGNKADMVGDKASVSGNISSVLTSPDTTVEGSAKTTVTSMGPTSIEGAIVKLN